MGLFDVVKRWKTTWFFVADPDDFAHNWMMWVPEDKAESTKFNTKEIERFYHKLRGGIPTKGWLVADLVGTRANWVATNLFINANTSFEPYSVCTKPFFNLL